MRDATVKKCEAMAKLIEAGSSIDDATGKLKLSTDTWYKWKHGNKGITKAVRKQYARKSKSPSVQEIHVPEAKQRVACIIGTPHDIANVLREL